MKWSKMKAWQKGGIIGFLIGILPLFADFFGEIIYLPLIPLAAIVRSKLGFSFGAPIVYTFLGVLIGFVISKFKSGRPEEKKILWIAISLGLLFFILSLIPIFLDCEKFHLTCFIIGSLVSLFMLPLYLLAGTQGGMILAFILPFYNFLVVFLISILIGFLILKFKRKKK